MRYEDFYDFSEKFWSIFEDNRLQDALEMVKNPERYLSKDLCEKNELELIAKEIYIYSETGERDKCIDHLKKLHKKGYPMPFQWGRFEFLKEHREYEEVEKRNWALHRELNSKTKFKYEVHLPKGYNEEEKYPLFFCLHGDGGGCTIEEQKREWKPDAILEKGYIVVYPQSSQAYCYNGYGWLGDAEISRKELKECYDKVVSEYSIDTERVVIGGFSGGANASIDAVYNEAFPLRGAIPFMPGAYLGKYLEAMEIEKAKGMSHRGVKLYIMEAELAIEPIIESHVLKVLDGAGVGYQYGVIEGIAHNCPKDIDERTVEALEYILENK